MERRVNTAKPFLSTNPPDQIKLNNQIYTEGYNKSDDFLIINLNKNGSNIIKLVWNRSLTTLNSMFDRCKKLNQ